MASLPNDRLDNEIASALREEMARHLELPVEAVKPCVALIPPQPEGTRGLYANVLAVELLRAGASSYKVSAHLGSWAERCEQPPKARHAFTLREVESTIKSAAKKQETEGLRGYGCKRQLAEYCPYGEVGIQQCPYISQRRRPMKRDKITTLLGAFNLAKACWVPKHWKPHMVIRRRYLHMAIGAVEAAKGYAGVELITSLRELTYQTGIARSSLRRDLEAMAEAGWIAFTPGLSRREKGDLPARGAVIRRLLPGESKEAERARLADVLKAFPGAEVVWEGEEGERAFIPATPHITAGGNT